MDYLTADYVVTDALQQSGMWLESSSVRFSRDGGPELDGVSLVIYCGSPDDPDDYADGVGVSLLDALLELAESVLSNWPPESRGALPGLVAKWRSAGSEGAARAP